MTSTQASNPRASLLAGLRTGGVRSSSASMSSPHTAAASANFDIPRYPSQQYYYEDEEEDQFYDLPSNAVFNSYGGARAHPVTAAVDGPDHRFRQQQRGLNPHSAPFNPSFNSRAQQQNDHQAQQAFQMQMMQLELLKMQQAQQYQAELLAQAQHQVKVERRASLGYGLPASAGPATNTFDFRSAAASAQMRRGSQQFPEQAPMTAAVGGKFSNRSISAADYGVNDRYAGSVPPTPASTTVISGGTSLGNIVTSNNNNNAVINVPSKSDTASSWRRGGPSNSVLSNRSVTSPVKTSNTAFPSKTRPQPLQFNAAVSRPLQGVAVADVNDADDGFSSDSSNSPGYNTGSSPTTPRSSSSSNESPLSPREEATKKLYEGLGIGRPKSNVSSTGLIIPSVTINDHVDPLPASYRMVSQPLRQPRGPPSGADELGPQNFATRIRRKAIGGLGALMGARERRESFVEAY